MGAWIMSTRYFLTTDSLKVSMTNTNGGTVEITNTFFTDLYKLWCVPFAAGSDAILFSQEEFESLGTPFNGDDYEDSLGLERHTKTGFNANPFFMTSEVIDGQEEIVIYGLNLAIPPLAVTGNDLNTDIGSNGDGTLFRAKGGDPETLQGGQTWTILNSDGFVKDEDDAEIKDTVLFTNSEDDNEELKFPMPLVIFGRSDMS